MASITSSAHPAPTPAPNLTFSVIDRDCREFTLVTRAFNDLIAPIYGSQEDPLAKIGRGSDRLCEMLYDADAPKALIVYKKALNSRGALELKTLVVLKPTEDSGRGYGSMLIKRVQEVAQSRMADFIEVSVSSQKPEALAFFQKKQFTVDRTVPHCYRQGLTETFLSRALSSGASSARAPAARAPAASPLPSNRTAFQEYERGEKRSLSSSSSASPAPVRPERRTHTCTLKGEYVRQILSGAKTFEGRIYSGFFRNYQVGDVVTWFAGDLKVRTEITEVRRFPSFDSMLRSVGFKNMLPLLSNIQSALAAYNGIPGYAEKAQQFGVVAFGVRIVPDQAPAGVATSSSAEPAGKRQRSESVV